LATTDVDAVAAIRPLPKLVGVLSQTTQVPAGFHNFVRKLVDLALVRNGELRVVDTICRDVLRRQQSAVELAGRVDLMFVVGSPSSANTKHLAELCATVTKTHRIETADEINASWLSGHTHVGVSGGTSASGQTIDEVVERLRSMA
jgi:4-hydroxy-3-methylbut-2-enyl diphosphate reductase